MNLYNFHTTASGWRATKFDEALNVEDAYIIVKNDGQQGHHETFQCSCPAGHRKDCKHRQMLLKAIAGDKVNTEWFISDATREWHRPIAASEGPIEEERLREALGDGAELDNALAFPEDTPERIEREAPIASPAEGTIKRRF